MKKKNPWGNACKKRKAHGKKGGHPWMLGTEKDKIISLKYKEV